MSDGIKSGIGQMAVDVKEAVVKPVADEVGKAIEEGVQSVVSGPKIQDPQAQQKQQEKQAEEQKRKAWALRVIEWNKKIDEEQKKVRDQNQQKIVQAQQEEKEKQKVHQFQVMEQQKKDQQLTETQRAARKTELKGGVGG